ncbi:hypothetical protein FA95DRAFT_1113528 [Auriscalpium vulgare]|uniref:Uncharacterized protein n=1 Tax=Auriscalpium vulgare TaxID=40419 RepID=A0ACB8R562_9AGAM|nr:hypothetical protein FA95DRAFT_1113528 [Auriscalpium vulgare]
MEWIMQMWPSVRAVSLWVFDDEVPDIRVPNTVQSMSLVGNDQINYFMGGTNIPLLRELELKLPTWDAFIERRLHLSGVLPHLRTLRIEGGPPPHQVLTHLTHLEGLIFTELPVDRVDILLPQTLIRVGYHLTRECVLDIHSTLSLEHAKHAGPFCAALRRLPKLQRISVTPHSSTHQVAMFNEVCRDRGIELEMYQDADHFWTGYDPVVLSLVDQREALHGAMPDHGRLIINIPLHRLLSSSQRSQRCLPNVIWVDSNHLVPATTSAVPHICPKPLAYVRGLRISVSAMLSRTPAKTRHLRHVWPALSGGGEFFAGPKPENDG